MGRLCINCNEFCNDKSDEKYKMCGGSYCKKYMRMTGINCKCIGDLYNPSELSIISTPTILTDYRARCCGTCKHNRGYVDEGTFTCALDEKSAMRDLYEICANHYEPEDY